MVGCDVIFCCFSSGCTSTTTNSAREGHANIVEILLEKGADPNVLDRWNRTPLDDALDENQTVCVKLLENNGAIRGTQNRVTTTKSGAHEQHNDSSNKRAISNMQIDCNELTMIDRIGTGAFGEIYKCR